MTRYCCWSIRLLPMLLTPSLLVGNPAGPGVPDPAAIASTQLEYQLELARSRVGEQKYQEALDSYHTYLLQAPGDQQALLELARVQSWAKHFDEAIATYNSLLHLFPDDQDLRLECYRVFLWAGRYDAAIVGLETLYAATPLAQSSGSPYPPDAELSPALASLGPDGFARRVARTLADAYSLSGRSHPAIVIYERLFAHTPADASLSLVFARALSADRSWQRALQLYDHLFQLPEYQELASRLDLRLERCLVMLWAEHYAAAIPSLLELLNDLQTQLEPNNPECASLHATDALQARALRALADAYAWSGDALHAAKTYSLLESSQPLSSDVELGLARAYKNLNLPSDALRRYDTYLELQPTDLPVELERAQMMVWAGWHDSAVKALRTTHDQVLDGMLEGTITEAQFESLLDEIERLLYQTFLWNGRPKEAIAYLRTLVARHPDDPQLELELARAFAQLGRFREARVIYAKYKGSFAATDAALGAAQTYQWEGDMLRARRAYRQALAIAPNNLSGTQALLHLNQSMRRPSSASWSFRTDADDFTKQSLAVSLETPVGLFYLTPHVSVDRYTAPAFEASAVVAGLDSRYRHNSRLEIRSTCALSAPSSTHSSAPAAFNGSASLRFAPDPALTASLEAGSRDAIPLLFARSVQEASLRQVFAQSSVQTQSVLGWRFWAATSAGVLVGEHPTNGIFQADMQFAKRRILATTRPTRLETGIGTRLLHLQHPASYWSPRLFWGTSGFVRVQSQRTPDLELFSSAHAGPGWQLEALQVFPEIALQAGLSWQISERWNFHLDLTYGSTVRTALPGFGDSQKAASPIGANEQVADLHAYWGLQSLARVVYEF